MGKARATALLVALAIIGLAAMRTATASHNADHKAFSGGATFKGLVVKTDRATTFITRLEPDWQTLDSRGFQIPAGESQLIVVDFFARTDCAGGDSCFVRVLAGPSLGTAQELEPAGLFSFDSTPISGDDGFESHAISRALCVRNAGGSPLNISVFLQATRDDLATSFSVGAWTFKIARNAPCSPSVDI